MALKVCRTTSATAWSGPLPASVDAVRGKPYDTRIEFKGFLLRPEPESRPGTHQPPAHAAHEDIAGAELPGPVEHVVVFADTIFRDGFVRHLGARPRDTPAPKI